MGGRQDRNRLGIMNRDGEIRDIIFKNQPSLCPVPLKALAPTFVLLYLSPIRDLNVEEGVEEEDGGGGSTFMLELPPPVPSLMPDPEKEEEEGEGDNVVGGVGEIVVDDSDEDDEVEVAVGFPSILRPDPEKGLKDGGDSPPPLSSAIILAFCTALVVVVEVEEEIPPAFFKSAAAFCAAAFCAASCSYRAYFESLYPTGSSKSTLQSVSTMETARSGRTSLTSM